MRTLKRLFAAGVLCVAPVALAQDTVGNEGALPEEGLQHGQEHQQQQGQLGEQQQESRNQIEGTVASVEQDRLVVKQDSGDEVTLHTDESTTVTQGGQQVSLDQLQEGSQVRASFSPSQGEPHATTIEVLSGSQQEPGQQPAQPPSGEPQGYDDSSGGQQTNP